MTRGGGDDRCGPGDLGSVAGLEELATRLRQVRVEPTGRVMLAVRYAAVRRAMLRPSPSSLAARTLQLGWVGCRVLTAAAILLGFVLGIRAVVQSFTHESAARQDGDVAHRSVPVRQDPGADGADDADVLPILYPTARADHGARADGPSLQAAPAELSFAALGPLFERCFQALQRMPDARAPHRWLQAVNELSVLRYEFSHRFSAESRRRSIVASGGTASLEDRIQALGDQVAEKAHEALAAQEIDVPSAALTLRALLAAGSAPAIGPHAELVSRLASWLSHRLPELEGGDLASALAGLVDLAVVVGGDLDVAVAEHSRRMALTIAAAVEPAPWVSWPRSSPHDPMRGARPALLHAGTSVTSLADAGRVLELAPAFGVEPQLAHRARLLVAAHLQERLATGDGERPELLAAQLYGFADLVDRQDVQRRLLLWRPRLLLPDFVAMHHLFWSQCPPRAGWSELQDELRALAAAKTPPRLGDAAALLLCLATNFAAPGVHEIGLIAGR